MSVGTSRKKARSSLLLTFAHIPAQVPDAVPRVERERSGEDNLARVLDGVRHACDELDDVRRVKGGGRDDVGESVAVENWYSVNGRLFGSYAVNTYGHSAQRQPHG